MAKAITILHRDGSTTQLASRSRATSISSARQKTSLLSEDVVNLTVTTTEPLPLAIGDRALFYGRAYTLNRLPQPRKEGERRYTYDITFEGAQYDLLDVHYHLPQNAYGETYYADLNGHLEVLRWNINRIFPDKWEITSDVPATDYKNITSSEKNCLAALQELCNTFEVEFVIGYANGKNTLRITKTTGSTFDRILRYGRGRGLYRLQRVNVNNANITNRLYAYGGSDNLSEGYIKTEGFGGRGCSKLCLPGTTRTTSFVEDAASISSYGVKEGEKNYPDIKPQRIGEVTAIGDDVVTFFDTSTDANGCRMFDLNAKKDDGRTTKYLIPGTTAKITFQTGQLAGYEFDLHSYEHSTNKFVINKFKDENGLELPNTAQGAFQIATGDKYIITDIILPPEYIAAAEQQLRRRATTDLLPMAQPQVSYKLTLDEAFFVNLYGTEAETVIFRVGDFIHIQDDQIGVDKEVRITQMERDLLRPHSYEITLSDTVTKSTTVKVLNELSELSEAVAVNTGFADPTKARRRLMATQEVLSMVFDPEGDYYSEKIKPLSIETQMLSVGAKSTQFTLLNTTFQPNYNGSPNTLCVSAGVLVHYGIDPTGIRNWHFGEVIMTGLSSATAYYIYARCDRLRDTAQMVLSTSPIACESDAAVYHFLVGVLNSVMADSDGGRPGRLVSLTYGSTTINGRFIKTGRIESSGGGSCYFDLDNDEIGGVIRFVNSDGQLEDVADVATKNKQLQDYISNTLPPILTGLQTIVDGKRTIFVVQPTTPYSVGDLWLKDVDSAGTAQGGLWRCITSRASGDFQPTDWVVATYYDCTQTVIDGGVVTSGTVQLVNSATEAICAGITGGESNDTAHGKVRIWAGASKENRHLAPFRVTQDGALTANEADITGRIAATEGRIGNLLIQGNYLAGLDADGIQRMRLGLGNIPAIEDAFERRAIPLQMTSDTAEISTTGDYTAEAQRRGVFYIDPHSQGDVNTANFRATVSFTVAEDTRRVTIERFYAGVYSSQWDNPQYPPTVRGNCTLYKVVNGTRTEIRAFTISQQSSDVVIDSLQRGDYEILADIRIDTGGNDWAGHTIFTAGAIWAEVERQDDAPGVTVLAQDGILSLSSSSRFFLFSFDNGFEARFDNAGIKVGSTGLQKLVNGQWQAL